MSKNIGEAKREEKYLRVEIGEAKREEKYLRVEISTNEFD